MEYAQFRAFYAPYWGVSSSTHYRVVKYSNSRASVYIERDGRICLIPVEVLNFTHIFKVG